MSLTIPLSMSEEQEDALIERLAEKVLQKCPHYGKRTKPYTVSEFHEVTGIPISSIYVEIKAERIRIVPNCGSKLIPASELERFL